MKAPAGKSLPKNTRGWLGIEEYNIAARPNWPQRGDFGPSNRRVADRIPDLFEGRREYA